MHSDRTIAVAFSQQWMAWFLFPLLALSLLLAWPGMADAKRLGSGGSFGSKSSYSRSYSKPVSPGTAPSSTMRQGASSSRFGGLGGMFGGLLMGGLIGSMLFGGGGFGGPGLLDLVLMGGLAFLLFRWLRSRRTATAGGPAQSYGQPASGFGSAGGWDRLGAQQQAESVRPVLPDGIDEREFLDGAKALYMRLQASWDRRDLNDIRQFASSEVEQEIARQAVLDPNPGRTEILMLEARVLEGKKEGTETVISVLFDAMLREDGPNSPAEQIREVWHMSRDESAGRPQWTLEGIQQLAV